MQKFKIIFDTATSHDLAAIATYRMEYLQYSPVDTKVYLRQLQNAFREKLDSSPLRWPTSREKNLHRLGLRICFGKRVAPYCAIFKVFPQTQLVLVYRIVHERSDYASLFQT